MIMKKINDYDNKNMELRTHQKQCVNIIKTHFKTNNKALIKMFCGSGKSYIIYDCLLKYGNDLSVVVVVLVLSIYQSHNTI